MTAHRAHTDAPSGDHDAVCDSIDPGARTHRHMAFAAPLAWRHTTGAGFCDCDAAGAGVTIAPTR
jgi:hypothetical protein